MVHPGFAASTCGTQKKLSVRAVRLLRRDNAKLARLLKQEEAKGKRFLFVLEDILAEDPAPAPPAPAPAQPAAEELVRVQCAVCDNISTPTPPLANFILHPTPYTSPRPPDLNVNLTHTLPSCALAQPAAPVPAPVPAPARSGAEELVRVQCVTTSPPHTLPHVHPDLNVNLTRTPPPCTLTQTEAFQHLQDVRRKQEAENPPAKKLELPQLQFKRKCENAEAYLLIVRDTAGKFVKDRDGVPTWRPFKAKSSTAVVETTFLASCLIEKFNKAFDHTSDDDDKRQGPFQLLFNGQALQPAKTLAEQGITASDAHYVIVAASLKNGMVRV